MTLPEIFTVTSQEYESVHATWCKAIKVLPDYSIVHKQDWFVKENYAPDLSLIHILAIRLSNPLK